MSLLIRGTVVTDTWPSCQVKVVGGAAAANVPVKMQSVDDLPIYYVLVTNYQ